MRGQRKNKKVVATYRRAKHEYEILDEYEAGMVLTGTEVKSLRQGKGVINEGYIVIKNEEAWVYQLYIGSHSYL